MAIGAIASHTDEMIFSSATLAVDLAGHAQRLCASCVAGFGRKRVREATAMDFSATRRNGLLRDDARFAEWLAGLDQQVVTDARG